MNWKKECLRKFKLYAITDRVEDDPEILNKIEGALRGGADIIQLRSKALSDSAMLILGKKIRSLTQKLRKLFIVNDRIDLMLALNADGVHLGQEDLPISEAHKIIGDRKKIIGRSTHSLAQAQEAKREGADYIAFGPIFATPTKPTYPPVGLEMISKVMKQIHIPVVCIGGINQSNVRQVIEAGARRVAVVRAIFSSEDTFEATRHLRDLMSSPRTRGSRVSRFPLSRE